MTSTDIGFWIATGAAVIAAFYTALMYHKPKEQAVVRPAKPPKGAVSFPASQRPTIPILLLLVTWGGVLFGYADRRYWSGLPTAEMPLSPTDARLDVRLWQPVINPDKQYFMNVFTINNGKGVATELRHGGLIMLTGARVPNSTLDAMFPMIRAQIALSEPGPKSDISPNQADTWFTVFGPKMDDKQSADIATGSLLPYILNVMQYRDSETPPHKFIYTESCVYYSGPALHFCENGHNRSYIAD